MPSLLADLRLVLRQLRSSPGFAATAVLMLGFGIGATTAIFSIVDGVLLRPLPFADPDRLVTLGDQLTGTLWGRRDAGPVTAPETLIYPRDTRSFASLGGYGYQSFELTGSSGEPAQIYAARMTPAAFATLGVRPLLGRLFTEQEDARHEQVAVLSYAAWRRRFNGSPGILGTRVLLDRRPYVVIGVMPASFEFPLTRGHIYRPVLWVPMSLRPEELSVQARSIWSMQLVGRLRPGVTVEQAEEDANRVAAGIMRTFPPDAVNLRIHAVVHPLQQITVLEARPLLNMLFLAVAVVLLLACANLAGLLLVRAVDRQRETAVRLAIGAPPWVVLRQGLLESLVLSISGGLVGLGLAAAAVTLGRGLLPETMPRVGLISLNPAVVLFALLLAVATGVLCGLAPGLAALGTNVNAVMKEGGRSGSSNSHGRLRAAFVVLEISIALVLVAASGLLLRSFLAMSSVDLGFEPDHVATGLYVLPREQYATEAGIAAFNDRLLRELRRLPGAGAVGLAGVLPTTGSGGEAFVAEGYVDPRGPDRTVAGPNLVLGEYFRAIGTPLIRGRTFDDSDNAAGPLVVIVNRSFAEHYWPHQSPIGRRMRLGTTNSKTPWMTVVGEVASAKLFAPEYDAGEQFFQPLAQAERDEGADASPADRNGSSNYIVLRSALPPGQTEEILRRTVRSIDPLLPLSNLETMNQVVDESEAPRRFNAVIISCFASAAVLLAALGIYSIIAFSVAARVRELAIRMALGSGRREIVRLILLSALRLGAVGAALGLAGAVAASRILRAFLFRTSPLDPVVLALTVVAVLVLSLAASALPALRAASINPVRALRGE